MIEEILDNAGPTLPRAVSVVIPAYNEGAHVAGQVRDVERVLKTAGHHVTFKLINEKQDMVYEGRAGMLDKLVPAGASIEVVMRVPPIAVAGRYRLPLALILAYVLMRLVLLIATRS